MMKKWMSLLLTTTFVLSMRFVAVALEPPESQEEYEVIISETVAESTQSTTPLLTATPVQSSEEGSAQETPLPQESLAVEPAEEVEFDDPQVPLGDGMPQEDSITVESDIIEETVTDETLPVTQISLYVKWEYDLQSCEEPSDTKAVKLKAVSEQDLSGLKLQWQVATKTQAQLKEGEEEWADVDGETGASFAFAANDQMRHWRWRLRATQENGAVSLSNEASLPVAIAKPETEIEEGDIPLDVEEKEQSSERVIPWSTISYLSDIPEEEITFGTEIMLSAEIFYACDGMQLQWQYLSEQSTEAWQSVEGAIETTHRYIIDETNYQNIWRLLITVEATEVAQNNEDDAPIAAEGQEPSDMENPIVPETIDFPITLIPVADDSLEEVAAINTDEASE